MNPEKFAAILLRWFAVHKRNLPWKHTADPYRIWISEIILQQTRVEQGLPYYHKFVAAFPDIKSLALADENEVLHTWQGLGYYSRARYLHHTAKVILARYDGRFPNEYHEVMALKGIGPYTAAAIMSFGFGQKYAVVDGNVIRLVTRLLGIQNAIEDKSVKEAIQHFVDKAIQFVSPADFNQGLMDFGATMCSPKHPKCLTCPFSEYCQAYQLNLTTTIPFKGKKIQRQDRFLHFFDLEMPDEKIIITQRSNDDIWNKLFQLPLIETKSKNPLQKPDVLDFFHQIFDQFETTDFDMSLLSTGKQVLTHRNIFGFFYKICFHGATYKINKDHYLVERSKVSNFAFPKILSEYFEHSSN